jgi:hypothetical protein
MKGGSVREHAWASILARPRVHRKLAAPKLVVGSETGAAGSTALRCGRSIMIGYPM